MDGYEIISELARGGMGVVYLARHRTMGRRVAIKTMLTGLDRGSPERSRFEVEAEAAAKLDHPGIVCIYEVGEFQDEPYIVMEWIDGENLATRLYRGPLTIAEATRVAIDVANSMSHAHQRGVVHRDLKPANVLLDCQQDDRPIITDFGVAKCIESIRGGLTTAGEPIGTPHYMPPEQADSSRGVIGPASDVYSIGAMIYAMLTGHPPFQAASSIDVILQVLSSEPVPPRRLNATIPATLEAIVMKCLKKDAKHRYKNAGELAQDLENFRDDLPTVARPLNLLGRFRNEIRRHMLLATVSSSGVVLLLVATLVLTYAYANATAELLVLKQEHIELKEVLHDERSHFRSQLTKLHNPELGRGEFDLARLASFAEFESKQNPTLATQLAIESIRLSSREALDPPTFCLSYLKTYVEKECTPQVFAALAEATPNELADAAESHLNLRLSETLK